MGSELRGFLQLELQKNEDQRLARQNRYERAQKNKAARNAQFAAMLSSEEPDLPSFKFNLRKPRAGDPSRRGTKSRTGH